MLFSLVQPFDLKIDRLFRRQALYYEKKNDWRLIFLALAITQEAYPFHN